MTIKNTNKKNVYIYFKPTLGANSAVQCISVDQEALLLTAAMGFQHIDRVDRVPGNTPGVHKLHGHGSVHHHVSKEVGITEGQRLRHKKVFVWEICQHHMQFSRAL